MTSFVIGWFTQYLCYAKKTKWTTKANGYMSTENQPKIMEAEEHRQDASVHAAARGRLITESQAANKMGDKKVAKELADRAKIEGLEMDRLNAEAATILFNLNNPRSDGTNDSGFVDLHGLFVKEALMYAELSIQNELDRNADMGIVEGENPNEEVLEKEKETKIPLQDIPKQVIFVVGMGNHSDGGIRKIKPALDEMIATKYPTFKIIDDRPHKGCMLVEFDLKGAPKNSNTSGAAQKRPSEVTQEPSPAAKPKGDCVIA
jgi:hypothetical protein